MTSLGASCRERPSLFDRPLCLISTKGGGQLQADENVLYQLGMIKENLVVVSIIGLYRTGKSFLMNRLFGRMDGFPLGNTIEAKTKGIWIWCKKHTSMKNTVIVLLDTEGLGDPKKGNIRHDNEICTLAALLCNVLVYNVMTSFNQDVVEKLAFISEMSRKITSQNDLYANMTESDYQRISPTFLLCIRDFTLELEINGEEVTEDEYLEDCFRFEEEVDDKTQRSNRTRACILRNLTKRKCFVFDRPCNKRVMMHMETARTEDLSYDFLQDSKKFSEYIYSCKHKIFLYSETTGLRFEILVRKYVEAIRNGAIPDIQDTYTAVANLENDRLANEAVGTFKQNLALIRIPEYSIQSLDEHYNYLKNSSLETFRRLAGFNSKAYENRALCEMEGLWIKFKHQNLERVCTETLKQMYEKTVGENYKRGRYKAINGFLEYSQDIGEMKACFKSEMSTADQDVVKQTLMSFTEGQKSTEDEIMTAAQALKTEEENEWSREFDDTLCTRKELCDVLKDIIGTCKKRGESVNIKRCQRKEFYGILWDVIGSCRDGVAAHCKRNEYFDFLSGMISTYRNKTESDDALAWCQKEEYFTILTDIIDSYRHQSSCRREIGTRATNIDVQRPNTAPALQTRRKEGINRRDVDKNLQELQTRLERLQIRQTMVKDEDDKGATCNWLTSQMKMLDQLEKTKGKLFPQDREDKSRNKKENYWKKYMPF